MTQAQHYKFQADQAKRLARQVTDSAVREKLRKHPIGAAGTGHFKPAPR